MELYGRSALDYLQSGNIIFRPKGDDGKTTSGVDELLSREAIKQMLDNLNKDKEYEQLALMVNEANNRAKRNTNNGDEENNKNS